MKKNVIFAIAVLLLIFGAVFVYAATLITIPSDGTIITPATLTSDPPSINWGSNIQQNEVLIQSVTLTNTGTEPTGILNVVASPTVGVLTNNVDGVIIAGGASFTATFTLTIDASAPIGYFSFPITISEP